MIRTYPFSITAAGGDGNAVGNTTTAQIISGYFVGLYIDYTTASMPSSTDLTITDVDHTITLFTAANYNTSGLLAPRMAAVSAANAAITDSHVPIPISGKIKLALAGANAGVVTGFLFIEEA